MTGPTEFGDSRSNLFYQRGTCFSAPILPLLRWQRCAITNDQQSIGNPIWEALRSLAHKLITALETVENSVAAYCFRSFKRNDVRFLRIKDFKHGFDLQARNGLPASRPRTLRG